MTRATGADVVPSQEHGISRPLFTTATGRPWQRSEAFRTVQRLDRRPGIDGQISPHSLRHAFATIALDAGVPLHALQDSLGHADPRTTRRYDRARNNLQKSAGYDVARVLVQRPGQNSRICGGNWGFHGDRWRCHHHCCDGWRHLTHRARLGSIPPGL